MKPTARVQNVIVEELGRDCVIYDTRTRKAHTLNAPVAWVWRHCDGLRSTEQLANSFEREFQVEDAGDIISSALDQLNTAGLLQEYSGQMISRRKVFAAGAVLAPVVASILVPTALAAASGNNGDNGNHGDGNNGDNGNHGNGNNGQGGNKQ